MKKLSLIAMIEAAFFAAFALILDLLPSIKLTPAVSISFAMVPILIIAFRWGVKVSFLSGFLWGLLQIAVGDVQPLSALQLIIEYFIAFACIGAAGLFYLPIQNAIRNQDKKRLVLYVIAATFVGSYARYFWHFLAGFIYWGQYAPKGMNPVWYSFIVNGGTGLGAAIFCSIILVILVPSASRLFIRKALPIETSNRHAS
ncbi:energy-coupled thiamine transporter ThiT [Cytobacillus sp. Hz8]|uniref:energy-coupled thiamine transporter ThiT n=1 Tax=Cytobacillus sp. Hz8 TaxID=3347168 RepID=UPI0035D96EDC